MTPEEQRERERLAMCLGTLSDLAGWASTWAERESPTAHPDALRALRVPRAIEGSRAALQKRRAA